MKKICAAVAIVCLCAFTFPGGSSGFQLPAPEKLHSALSLEGFTGVLNTPSAHVTAQGEFDALYSNSKESKWRDRKGYEDDYLFSVGFFSFAEVGARLTASSAGRIRDLSGNFKVTSAPFTRKYPLLPVVAVGMQDVGGGDKHLQTKYAVVSEDLWRLRLSAGYGSGPDRMKGAFAGAELKALEWVYLLGEYDTVDTNVGIRVVTPQLWKIPISVTATAKTALSHKNIDIGVGINLPLDFRKHPPSQALQVASLEQGSAVAPVVPAVNAAQPPSGEGAAAPLGPAAGDDQRLVALSAQLTRHGFLNVRVGMRGDTLVVEYENVRYNHNELDAMGVVAGMATDSVKGSTTVKNLAVIVRRRDIALMQFTAPLAAFGSFFDGGVPAELSERLTVSSKVDTNDVRFVGGERNRSLLKTTLILAPGLSTWVGTEVGVFDYLLSLKPELVVQGWKGAVLDARWDIPLSWSENLEDRKPYRGSRNHTQLERLMLFQGVKLLPDVMLNLGAGMYLHDQNGTVNEVTWSPGSGAHRFRAVQGYLKDSNTHKSKEVYTGSYRYYFSPLDLSLEGTAGRFFAEDTGFSVELKRFFADTAVSLYFKDSKAAADGKKWQSVGIIFSFPLTPRRDMKPYPLQVRGSEQWSYSQESTLKNNNIGSKRGALNYLAPYPLTVGLTPSVGLLQAYQNRDRLNEVYLKEHLERLREAWSKFKE